MKINGTSYDVAIKSIKRKARIVEGPNADELLSGDRERDLVGTYYDYQVVFDTNKLSPADYDSLYLAVTSPVNSVMLSEVPFGRSLISFSAYVDTAEDDLTVYTPATKRWRNLTIWFYAKAPYSTPA